MKPNQHVTCWTIHFRLKNMRIFLSVYPNWLSYKRFNRSVNLQGLNLCLLVISLLFTCCD